MIYDVAIIGGGPAGSTVASLLKKYSPDLKVVVLERETFPRDHIGESLLPPTSRVIDELGCWDAIEAAGFPIKLGATFRWGRRPELWDFDFYPVESFTDEPRPAPYRGQRLATAFQVDRSIYDKILLDHSAGLGCEVRQGTKVVRIEKAGDAVKGLLLDDGTSIEARYYVDASGNSGILRREMGVECDYPSTLKNIAIYDYWQNADWAVKIGVGGTRIQVLTVGYGWLWFIPLGPTRTSLGLVVPAEYYKQSGENPTELYERAIREETRVSELLTNAKSEGKLQTTRDWSFLANRQYGENWFLVGECAGFADPILSAGVTMAHISGRQLAYTILELERGKLPAAWLKREFESRQSQRVRTHIRFGDYWYTANEQLVELKDFTTRLAQDTGLEMTPQKAWEWLARGGFIDEDLSVGAGGYSLASIKATTEMLADLDAQSPFELFNEFKLNLNGATWKDRASYFEGRIRKTPCYVRGERVLPIEHDVEAVVTVLERFSDIDEIVFHFRYALKELLADEQKVEECFGAGISVIEAMVADGWIDCSYNPERPLWRPEKWNDRPIRWSEPVAKVKS
jgi:flavin-dependent dehydrogenase